MSPLFLAFIFQFLASFSSKSFNSALNHRVFGRHFLPVFLASTSNFFITLYNSIIDLARIVTSTNASTISSTILNTKYVVDEGFPFLRPLFTVKAAEVRINFNSTK